MWYTVPCIHWRHLMSFLGQKTRTLSHITVLMKKNPAEMLWLIGIVEIPSDCWLSFLSLGKGFSGFLTVWSVLFIFIFSSVFGLLRIIYRCWSWVLFFVSRDLYMEYHRKRVGEVDDERLKFEISTMLAREVRFWVISYIQLMAGEME